MLELIEKWGHILEHPVEDSQIFYLTLGSVYTDCAKRIESRNLSYPVLQIVKLARFGLVYLANTK